MSKAKGADSYTEGPLRRRCLPSVKTGSLTKRPMHTLCTHVHTVCTYCPYICTYVLSMHMKVYTYSTYVLYIHTYVCTMCVQCVHTHMHVCAVHSYERMYVCMDCPYVHTYVRTYSAHTYICLPAFIHLPTDVRHRPAVNGAWSHIF